MTDDSIREMLRELGDEPVPAGSLHRVRAGIEEGIRAGRRRWTWGGLLLAPAAIAVVLAAWFVAAWFVPVRTAPGPAAQKAAAQKDVTIAAAPRIETTNRRESSPAIIEPAVKRSEHRAVHRMKRVSASPLPPARGLQIRIETPDPDVVILLIGQ
jgi:hypothetical protein